ncbi:MAG: HEAT repeat domain-containing protein [Planctomycetaceae bacterium]|nr:HEAT repeat domain-containing protein [Planctomycetaceae bacterium]
MASATQAGLLCGSGSGGCKSCECAPTCQPTCCAPVIVKPTIERPCDTTVHTYQRKVSCLKPPCCETSCAPKCCAPAPVCEAPCAPACGPAPCAQKKCLLGGGGGFSLFSCFKGKSCGSSACGAPACQTCAPACQSCNTCEAAPVCDVKICDADPCEIAKLIYESQTACYAKDRKKAIDDLGDFDCECNPEIMGAFLYALNDADEKVRANAADEIGDQLRKRGCGCNDEIINALKVALGDCDRKVRRQAEEALEAAGYEIVDGCCQPCGAPACSTCGGVAYGAPLHGAPVEGAPVEMAPEAAPTEAAPSAPMPMENGPKAAPAPPKDPEAYFPSRLRQTHRPRPARNPLAGLFGLLD